jgi:predicted  nucleic acid-binding Zn-ribbon protein
MTQHASSSQSQHGQITPLPSINRPASRQTSAFPSRREYLLRRKLDLEMEVHDLLARLDSLDDEQLTLDEAKEHLQQQVPALKKQVAVSGLFGVRQTPAERVFAYQVQRIAQEKARIERDKIRYAHQLQAVHAKLDLLDGELDLLP